MNRPGAVPKSHRQRARDLLVQALYQWQLSGSTAEQIEVEFRADNGRKVDWEFFHDALSGIISAPLEIDVAFLPHLDRDPSQLDPIETGILRLGVFELSKRMEVPYKVVINECVELAKKYGATDDSYRFVNGILDKAARQLRALEVNAG